MRSAGRIHTADDKDRDRNMAEDKEARAYYGQPDNPYVPANPEDDWKEPTCATEKHYDVLIIGAGLAGLALARQLLLYTDKRILLVDKRTEFPPAKAERSARRPCNSPLTTMRECSISKNISCKSTILKYNLRFYWKTPGTGERLLRALQPVVHPQALKHQYLPARPQQV